ncbi:MAG TPA: hypothetical protein VJT14_05305 [Candidatus Dormibacteraeota bacterium]|nr:hypothetical protein [Candidatus Dormibacteraeota bacterium]
MSANDVERADHHLAQGDAFAQKTAGPEAQARCVSIVAPDNIQGVDLSLEFIGCLDLLAHLLYPLLDAKQPGDLVAAGCFQNRPADRHQGSRLAIHRDRRR